MRGAERPGRIQWTRPFLKALNPLSHEAAREVFFDISLPVEDETQVAELLKFTDNVPLAVTLIAYLASDEGCDSVISRWKTESTSLLSDGLDKRSNLDKSIMMSITSPRMVATPGARELLSVLSVLPDGVSEKTLEDAGIPLSNIASCRLTLCRTSLTFVDRDDRLKILMPIRQYIRKSYPPSPALLRPLQNFLYDLLKPFEAWDQTPDAGLFQLLTQNKGNIKSLIEYTLTHESDLVEIKATIYCVIHLSTWQDHFATPFDDPDFCSLVISFEQLAEKSDDPHLQGYYFLAVMFLSERVGSLDTMEYWAEKALRYFGVANDAAGQGVYCVYLFGDEIRVSVLFCSDYNSRDLSKVGILSWNHARKLDKGRRGLSSCSPTFRTSGKPLPTVAISCRAFKTTTSARRSSRSPSISSQVRHNCKRLRPLVRPMHSHVERN